MDLTHSQTQQGIHLTQAKIAQIVQTLIITIESQDFILMNNQPFRIEVFVLLKVVNLKSEGKLYLYEEGILYLYDIISLQ